MNNVTFTSSLWMPGYSQIAVDFPDWLTDLGHV